MTSLAHVLEEAASGGAIEITLEPGKAQLVRTDAGSVCEGATLAERELFDALIQVLGPDQQAELAVGNVVEFHVDVGVGRWTLIGEPLSEGIVVRGRLQGGSTPIEMGQPLDLPPLAPFEPDRRDDIPNTAPSPLFRRTGGAAPGSRGGPEEDAVTARAEPDTDDATAGDSPRKPIAIPLSPLPSVPDPVQRGDDEPPAVRVEPDRMPPMTRADLDEQLDVVSVRSPGTGESTAARWVGGTLCFASTRDGSEWAAATGLNGAYRLVEDDVMEEALAEGGRRTPGGTFVIRLEDPSRALGWILRRLEEGSRVVVETRARSPLGARRMLLGLTATPRAEDWLTAYTQLWVRGDAKGYVIEAF